MLTAARSRNGKLTVAIDSDPRQHNPEDGTKKNTSAPLGGYANQTLRCVDAV